MTRLHLKDSLDLMHILLVQRSYLSCLESSFFATIQKLRNFNLTRDKRPRYYKWLVTLPILYHMHT